MDSMALRIEDLPHYTYKEYVQWEGKWELIHGIPYAMTPAPGMRHQRVSHKIAYQLEKLLSGCSRCSAYLPVDWQIDEETVVQPDNLVICGNNIEGEKLTITPVLIFEILSPATTRKDRILKFQLYQDAGVKYYCIIDLENSSADVFELLHKNYRKKGTFAEGKRSFHLGPCTIEFDFGEVFG